VRVSLAGREWTSEDHTVDVVFYGLVSDTFNLSPAGSWRIPKTVGSLRNKSQQLVPAKRRGYLLGKPLLNRWEESSRGISIDWFSGSSEGKRKGGKRTLL